MNLSHLMVILEFYLFFYVFKLKLNPTFFDLNQVQIFYMFEFTSIHVIPSKDVLSVLMISSYVRIQTKCHLVFRIYQYLCHENKIRRLLPHQRFYVEL